ncbi:hypothetical protein FACS1894105_09880 [Clostridia bacterium]|nr:hypothetical protein FACS1894105_09880 [Clostridia bacterium]
MQTVFKTENLIKKYNSQLALNELNMEVHQGEIYGLVGKNGAGKSTLMKLMFGLIHSNGGDFEIFGVRSKSAKISEVRRRMGGFIELPAFYPHLTAFENLKTDAIVLGIKDKRRIIESLETVGLDPFNKKKARNFSLGMKQRLGIARALLSNAEFIVLDEPTNGLDPEGIVELRDFIIKLNREQGITFLISSHYISELEHVITHLGIINNGHMIEQITKENLSISKGEGSVENYVMGKIMEALK